MIRIFKHYMPKGLLFLGIVEAAILLGAVYIGVSLRFLGGTDGAAAADPILPHAMIFVMVMILVMTALGLYQRELKEGEWGYFPRLGVSFVLGLGILSLIFWVIPSLSLGGRAVALAFLIAVTGLGAARLFYLKLSEYRPIKKRVLVLGTGSRAFRVGELERSNQGRTPFHVVGYLPVSSGGGTGDGPILPRAASLSRLVGQHRIEEIVVGVRDRRGALPLREILDCKLRGIDVVDLPTFFERETGRILLDSISPSWLIFSDGFRQGRAKTLAKRVFDLAVSLGILIPAAPVMLVTALLVWWEDRGPVLYRQERVGQHGAIFSLLKFRSMRTDAERDGKPQWAKVDDDRTTRVGRVIRKFRIDELPQLLNVLLGHMSLVGPRPERPFFVRDLQENIPYYACRHAVKPGITGWAQVRYPYGASIEDAVEKLQYDLYYVKNNSVFLDVIILFQTVQVLLWNDGAR